MSPESGFRGNVGTSHHIALVLVVIALLSANAGVAYSGNSIEIESKWVDEGQQDVTLGIYLKNDRNVGAIVVPLEIRSIHVGSFVRRSLDIRPNARLISWAGDVEPVIAELYFPYRSQSAHGIHCPTDSLGRVWRWMANDSLPDFMGEEGLLYAFMSASLETPFLRPGDDGESGSGTPSLSLVFDVTDVGGAFIIDSTCTAPANHVCFVDPSSELIEVQFRPAIVLIGCDAECHGDPNCDGICNLVDLVRSVDVAFKGAPPVIDPDPRCPVENTDVNCDLVTNVQDIVKMINVQYRHAAANVEFCAPCEHIPRSGNPKEDVRTPYFRNNGT